MCNARLPVRCMGPGDISSVARLLMNSFGPGKYGAGITPHATITDGLVSRWCGQSAASWVVEAPGFGPVGAMFAVIEPQVGWFGGLSVHPAYRGLGAGRALITVALAFLEEAGCPVVGLEVSPGHGGPLSAYARRGLQVVDVTVRLRAESMEVASAGPAVQMDMVPLGTSHGPPHCSRVDLEGLFARVDAVPLSQEAFVVASPGAGLVCDTGVGTSMLLLDVRLGFVQLDDDLISGVFCALAQTALARGLHHLEVDLPVACGRALATLYKLGFSTISSSVRMARPGGRYIQAQHDRVEIGRWAL